MTDQDGKAEREGHVPILRLIWSIGCGALMAAGQLLYRANEGG